MRLFYGFVAMLLLSYPFARWYLAKYARIPNFLNVNTSLLILVPVCYLLTMLLHLWLPTFREHMEPVLTEISLMYLAGYPLYSTLDEPNIYSMIYGPSTLLLQAQFLRLINDPVFAVKLYGVSCVLLGVAVLYIAMRRKFGSRLAALGIFYYAAMAMLFAQVSFRNHSDCAMFLGASLGVASLLLPSSWRSVLLLATGGALAVNAKFHSAAFIFPLLVLFYRQHGMVKLGWTIVLACGMIILPFTLPGVSISGYLALISAYSGLWVHPLAITHNIWMTLTMLVPVLYLLYVDKKTAPDGRLDRDLFWTLLLTLAMVFGVGVLGAVDGAGIYHMAPFAPLFSVLFVILYDRNKDRLPTFMDGFDKQARALYLAVFVAWFASMAFFTSSAQKKVLNYAWDNHSVELRDEVLSIRDFLQGRYQQVLIGYTDHPNHKLTYVRSWLWPVVKGNVVDPVVFAGRQAVGLDLPEATLKRFGQQYYDVIIMPGEGEPYSMDNWHNRKLLVFGEQLPVLFRQNYVVWKTWPHFTLWRAKRHG